MFIHGIRFTHEQLKSLEMAILLTIGQNEYRNQPHEKEMTKSLIQSLKLVKADLDLFIKLSGKNCPGCRWTFRE